MIKHIVIWRLKNRENEQTREETARAIKQKIEGMRGKLPGLLRWPAITFTPRTKSSSLSSAPAGASAT